MADEEEEFEGASVEEQLLGAAKRDNLELLQEALAQVGSYDINVQDGLGNSPLHYIAQFGDVDAGNLIFAQPGVRLDLKNRQWNTPLHLAAENDQLEFVRFLIEKGASPSAQNKLKQQPLNLASSKEVKELLQAAILARRLDDEVASDPDEDGNEAEDEGDD